MKSFESILSTLVVSSSLLFANEDWSAFMIAIKSRTSDIGEALFSLDRFVPFFTYQKCWYADPMLFKYEGKNYLFYENYPLDTRKGIISCVIVNEDLSLSEPIDVLEEEIHLSFPYVFQDGAKIYMTPETYDFKKIVLYEALEFPHKWSKSRTLVSGNDKFSDPILFQYNGYYWIFATVNMYELVIYYADSLEGQFIPHPINEKRVIGRNAGGVFFQDGALIRPVMDCTLGYGRAMELHEITALSPTDFQEECVWRIEPDWMKGLQGTHTFSLTEDLIVYDGYLNYSDLLAAFPMNKNKDE